MTMAPPPPDLAHAASGSLAYVDEEELLGFKIWVAELELLVRPARLPAACCWGGLARRH